MAFYDLNKADRILLVQQMEHDILLELQDPESLFQFIVQCSADEDTYIRKAVYNAIGKIHLRHPEKHAHILKCIRRMYSNTNYRIRQTAINAAGEIGKRDFEAVQFLFDTGLFDSHHSPRNAVIGSIKKMSEKNPVPVLAWARQYLSHPAAEIRREICHGIELRGRTHPLDILPLLKVLQFDKVARVRNTLVHVIGQIAYKKGCLEPVILEIHNWENQSLVMAAIAEIIDVHHRYRNFSFYSQDEAIQIIDQLTH